MAKKFVMKKGTFTRLFNSRGMEGVTCKTCGKTIEVGQRYYLSNKNGRRRDHVPCFDKLFIDIPDEESEGETLMKVNEAVAK
ncbi:MAG: hypothetical protein NWF05_08930 [Candidatus Bathyarchaeota archaeon]|nr:hypothetical protein [Candidatus Bathyarchaeota archaeon]